VFLHHPSIEERSMCTLGRAASAALAVLLWACVGCGGKAESAPAPAVNVASTPVGAVAPGDQAAPPAGEAAAAREAADEAPPDDEAAPRSEVVPSTDEVVLDDAAAAAAFLTPGPRAHALCAKQEGCGCPGEACAAELAEFERAIPEVAWTCIMDQSCDTLCTGEGTQSCLIPVGESFQAALRSARIDRYCARHAQCGCALEACRDNLVKAEQAAVIEYAACATRLACPAVCEEGQKQVAPGMVAYEHCLAPLLAQQNSTHRTNMAIIRSIGNTNSRRVYDADGNYLRNE